MYRPDNKLYSITRNFVLMLTGLCVLSILTNCSSQIHGQKLEEYFDKDKYNEVISYSDSKPDLLENERVRLIRAKAFYELRLYETALKEIYECIKLSKTVDAETYIVKGRIEEGIGMIASAKDSYASAMKIEPNNSTPYFRAGVIQYNSRVGLDTVMFFLNRSIELNQKNPESINFRGLVYGDLQQHQKSLDDHLAAIRLDSLESKYYFNASVAYFYLDDLESALEYADRSIQLDSENGMLYDSKAAIYLVQGDTAKACEVLSSAIKFGYTPESWFKEVCGF